MNENVLKRIKEADESEGYFITITTLKEGKLRHYQRQQGIPIEDIMPSLEEIKKMIFDKEKLI